MEHWKISELNLRCIILILTGRVSNSGGEYRMLQLSVDIDIDFYLDLD